MRKFGWIGVIVFWLCSTSFSATTTFDANAVIQDGDVYDVVVIVGDNTVVEMTGGTINGGLFLYNVSTINISGGVINADIKTFHSSSINVTLGQSPQIGNILYAYDSSRINVAGSGEIWETIVWQVNLQDSSTMSVSNGTINDIFSRDSSTLNMSGGRIDGIVQISSTIPASISGGSIPNRYIVSVGGGIINLSGGSINEMQAFSPINVFGHDLSITTFGGNNGFGELTGFLADETPINASFFNQDAYLYINLNEGGTPPPICETRPASDINWDCEVNFLDFATMMSEWLDCGLSPVEACSL